jgi:hypothetical protein
VRPAGHGDRSCAAHGDRSCAARGDRNLRGPRIAESRWRCAC